MRVANLADTYDANGTLAFSLADLNVRSYGVPALTALKVTVGGVEVGTVAVAEDGTAAVSLDLAGKGVTNGTHEIVLTDAAGTTGTTVRLSANFTGEVVEPTPAPSDEPTVAPSAEPTVEPTIEPTAAPSSDSTVVAPAPSAPAVWDDLGRPIKSDEAGFHQGLDADKDGEGCEQDPNYTNKAEDGSDISNAGSSRQESSSSSSSTGSSLANTGFTASMIAGAGALTLLAGGAALVANRRRKA